MTALDAAVVAAAGAAAVPAGIRWLRVAQREHYLPGAASRFALRWWGTRGQTPVALAALAAVVLTGLWPAVGFLTAAVVAAGPRGLGLKGRTAPLAWTRRARTLAGVGLGLLALALALGVAFGLGPVVAVATAFAVPLLVDLACAITAPLEGMAAAAHVGRARERLARVAPTVVAITGSYGKTSTKGYIAHLLAGTKTVVASPASFNNRAGLARAVNENLADGTEVFVAEMGTYGPGEIAELCTWLPPDIAVITAIGPVHLERFRSEDRIVTAKAEILSSAATVVLNVDDPRLAALADTAAAAGRRVRRGPGLSPDTPAAPAGAELAVAEEPDAAVLWIGGQEIARLPPGPRPGNVACAVAVALELGVPVPEIVRRLAGLPAVPHRLTPGTAPGGFAILDDTYNANPAGAAAALEALRRSGSATGRRVVVTPGLVELGPRQAAENSRFAAAVAAVADDLLIVGRTNRRALLAGAGPPAETANGAAGGTRVLAVDRRAEAVDWVRHQLGPGDVVLYENDLPDHYP